MWLRTAELWGALRSTSVLYTVFIVNNLTGVFRVWYAQCKLL